MKGSRLAIRAVSAAALSLICVGAYAQLYFTDIFNPDFNTGHIRRVNTDGTGLSELVDTGGGVRGLAVDFTGGKMYWADVDNLLIRRSNLDGSGIEDIIHLPGGQDPAFPSEVAVDEGKIYWGDQTLGTMNRANLDGSDQEVLFSTPFHRGLAIDHANGKLYWDTSISQFKGEIWRSNMDGSNPELVMSSLEDRFKPNKLALDIGSGKIYWTDYVADLVQRANIDGTGLQTLYVPPFNRNPQGIALDLQHGTVFWGQDLEIEGHTGKIMAMNLDGSNAHDFLTGFGQVTEIVDQPVPEPSTLAILSFGALSVGLRKFRKK